MALEITSEMTIEVSDEATIKMTICRKSTGGKVFE